MAKLCSFCAYFNYDEIWDGQEETELFSCGKNHNDHIGWNTPGCDDWKEKYMSEHTSVKEEMHMEHKPIPIEEFTVNIKDKPQEFVSKETVKNELKSTLVGMDHKVDEWVDRIKGVETTEVFKELYVPHNFSEFSEASEAGKQAKLVLKHQIMEEAWKHVELHVYYDEDAHATVATARLRILE